jgi:hypothetical protein
MALWVEENRYRELNGFPATIQVALIATPSEAISNSKEEHDAHDSVQQRLDLGIWQGGGWSTIDSLQNRSPRQRQNYQALWLRSSWQSVTSAELISPSCAIRRLTLFL